MLCARLLIVIAVVAFGISSGSRPAEATPPLWIEVPARDSGEQKAARPEILRSQEIHFMDDGAASFHAGIDRRSVHLFDDFARTAVFHREETNSVGSVSLFGRFEEETDSLIILVRTGDAVAAHMMIPSGGVFEVRPTPNGEHELVQIDQEKLPGCGCSEAHRIKIEDADPAVPRNADDGSLIDVLVLYTSGARSGAGGTASIQSLITMAVNQTNTAYENSLINPRLRLVHMAETDYPDTFDMNLDLTRLTNNNDGFMDEAHTLRNTYGADLVALIINYTTDFCGLAWITGPSTSYANLGFSVTARQCATSNWTFAHELGHNTGCHHDRDNAGGEGAYSYSYGHRFTASFLRKTIMAYPPGSTVAHFSNPDVNFSGVPTGVPIGDPLEAHNAQTVNNMAIFVSNFRKAIPDDLIPPDPNPMTFASPPSSNSTTSITMTASTATDDTLPVQYFFEEMTGNPGGNSSSWQALTSYVDSGLSPNTQYIYRVKARDSSPAQNETAYSETAPAVTRIQTPTSVASINTTHTSVQLTAAGTFTNLNVGDSGILFESEPPGDFGGIGVWSQITTTTVTGLLAGRTYSFRARARNQEGVETPLSSPAIVETFPYIGDCNDDGFFNLEGDLPCFVDALLGIETAPGSIERSDLNYDGVTDGLDIREMVFCFVQGCN